MKNGASASATATREPAATTTLTKSGRETTRAASGFDLETEGANEQEDWAVSVGDLSAGYYPIELIQSCQDDLELPDDFTRIEYAGGSLWASVGVSRTANGSQLVIFEDVSGVFTMRFWKSFRDVPFRDQEAFLRGVLTRLPLKRMRIDETGIGMHLAENLSADFECVEMVTSTAANKARWCLGLKTHLQRSEILLPIDKDLLRQILSVQRETTGSGNIIFTGPRADMFWTIATAVDRSTRRG